MLFVYFCVFSLFLLVFRLVLGVFHSLQVFGKSVSDSAINRILVAIERT
jgi:hypothetical protein